jgi:hypothetical protein
MVVRISRTEDSEIHRLLLRVEGALTHEGAQLLAQQCVPCIHDAEWSVEIDLTAVTFLNEAAAVVRRLSQSPSVSLTGCELFTPQMIEAVPPGEGGQLLIESFQKAQDVVRLEVRTTSPLQHRSGTAPQF